MLPLPRLLALLSFLLAGCASTVPQAPVPFEIDGREYSRVYEAARLVLRDYGFILDRQDYRFGRITTYALAAPTLAEPWYGANSTAYLAVQNTLNDQRRRVTVFLDPAGAARDCPLFALQKEGTVPPESAARQFDGTVPLPAKQEGDSPSSESAARQFDGTVPLPAKQEGDSPSTAPATQPSVYLLRVEVALERRQYPQRRPTDAPDLIYDLAALPAELSERGIKGAYWQPVGTDPYLEQRLLADIVRRSVNLP